MSSTKKVLLKSCDGETFEVDEAVVLVSVTIKNMIDDGCADDVIPLLNVSSDILPKVIEYCNKKQHVRDDIDDDDGSSYSYSYSSSSSSSSEKKNTILDKKDEKEKEPLPEEENNIDKEREKAEIEEVKKWEAEYMDIDQQVLLQLLHAANYLNIKGLMNLAVEKAASMIRGRTPEQIRKAFGIKNDFTPEEEEAIKNENAWAFQD